MLNIYPRALADRVSLSSRDLTDQAWVDLVCPTEAERAMVERASGLRVPSENELGEIEATSRLQTKDDTLYMTAPLIFAAANEPWIPTPVGFVLSKKLLLTVRSAKSAAFDAVAKDISAMEQPDATAVFVCLLEELIDRLADLLQSASRDLDDASHTIFRTDARKHLSRETVMLRRLMISTGRTSERTHVKDTFCTGLSRPHGEVHDRPRARLDQARHGGAVAIDQFGRRVAGALLRRPGQPRSAAAGRRGRHHQ